MKGKHFMNLQSVFFESIFRSIRVSIRKDWQVGVQERNVTHSFDNSLEFRIQTNEIVQQVDQE